MKYILVKVQCDTVVKREHMQFVQGEIITLHEWKQRTHNSPLPIYSNFFALIEAPKTCTFWFFGCRFLDEKGCKIVEKGGVKEWTSIELSPSDKVDKKYRKL